MKPNWSISKFMQVDETDRNIEWLRYMLQKAVTLEFFTIPPYLTAWWSIKDENDPTALSIREVVQEEMAHMAIACNLLVSLGAKPKIAQFRYAPIYPSAPPGGVRPSLRLDLGGLSKKLIREFVELEAPEDKSGLERVYKDHLRQAKKKSSDYRSIGDFYNAIWVPTTTSNEQGTPS